MTKVFITHHALTKGIVEIEAEIYKSNYNGQSYIMDGYNVRYIGKSAFLEKQEAITKAEDMRKKKITSLKKQISKLEKITF